jgi:hypothetical protein
MVAEVIKDFDLGVIRYDFADSSDEMPAERDAVVDEATTTAVITRVPPPEPPQPRPLDDDRSAPLDERPMFSSSGRRRFSLFNR